jgi:hypothetical protein
VHTHLVDVGREGAGLELGAPGGRGEEDLGPVGAALLAWWWEEVGSAWLLWKGGRVSGWGMRQLGRQAVPSVCVCVCVCVCMVRAARSHLEGVGRADGRAGVGLEGGVADGVVGRAVRGREHDLGLVGEHVAEEDRLCPKCVLGGFGDGNGSVR